MTIPDTVSYEYEPALVLMRQAGTHLPNKHSFSKNETKFFERGLVPSKVKKNDGFHLALR